MADAQAGQLDRPVRHLGVYWLRPVHHLVPRGHRPDGGSGRHSRRNVMTTLAPPTPSANPWVPQLATIRGIKKEVPGIQTYELDFNVPTVAARFRFHPGQFNMLYLPGIGEAAIS